MRYSIWGLAIPGYANVWSRSVEFNADRACWVLGRVDKFGPNDALLLGSVASALRVLPAVRLRSGSCRPLAGKGGHHRAELASGPSSYCICQPVAEIF